MPGGREAGHVGADLSKDHVCGTASYRASVRGHVGWMQVAPAAVLSWIIGLRAGADSRWAGSARGGALGLVSSLPSGRAPMAEAAVRPVA
jgi:hypothetical protein